MPRNRSDGYHLALHFYVGRGSVSRTRRSARIESTIRSRTSLTCFESRSIPGRKPKPLVMARTIAASSRSSANGVRTDSGAERSTLGANACIALNVSSARCSSSSFTSSGSWTTDQTRQKSWSTVFKHSPYNACRCPMSRRRSSRSKSSRRSRRRSSRSPQRMATEPAMPRTPPTAVPIRPTHSDPSATFEWSIIVEPTPGRDTRC
jgi:hypothetical protein